MRSHAAAPAALSGVRLCLCVWLWFGCCAVVFCWFFGCFGCLLLVFDVLGLFGGLSIGLPPIMHFGSDYLKEKVIHLVLLCVVL